MSKQLTGSLTLTVFFLGLALIPIPFRQWANLRIAGGFGAFAFSIVGYCISGRQKEEQQALDLWEFEEQQKRKKLDAAIEPVLAAELVQKQEIRVKYSVADTEEEMKGNFTVLQVDRYGEDWLTQNEPKQIALPSETETSETVAETPETKAKAETLGAKKKKLLKLIDEHEDGWIGQLMKKPILIYGDQGSGKSYFAEFLALCRHYLRGHEIVSIADPHFHQNRDECWKNLVKLGIPGFGAHHNYSEVNSQILGMYDRFSKRTLKSHPVTSIFDEVTRYGQEEATQESANKLGSKLSSDPRKAKESPILIAHAKTLVALGGGEGFADAIQGNFIRIKLNSNSEQEPLWKGVVSGIKDGDGESIEGLKVSIAPDWIRSQWVYDLFNSSEEIAEEEMAEEEIAQQKEDSEKGEFVVQNTKADFLEEARKWLNDVYEAEAEVTSETTPINEGQKVTSEVAEVHNSNTSSNTLILPEDVRSKALTRVLTLLNEAGSASDEVIAITANQPERAIWIGIKLLKKSMTATSRDIFGMGTGGAKFKTGKTWYESLKKEFD